MTGWGVEYDVSRSSFWGWGNTIRSFFRQASFFRRQPRSYGTTVNADLTRALYRNESHHYRWAGGFVRPIVDLTVQYLGRPTVTGISDSDAAFLNECIQDYWAPKLDEAIRDALRDSKAWVRFWQPRSDNPLFTDADRQHGAIEVLPLESVQVTWNAVDKNLMESANIEHEIEMDDRSPEEKIQGKPPRLKVHTVVETITRSQYTYYDKTAGVVLDTWAMPNVLSFVPLWPAYNEYAADLGGGQSDIESVLPFIEAFHDVFEQTMTAHKHHSSPIAKFKLRSVENFLKNNFPEAIDDDGKVIPNSAVSWSGREILFFSEDEDAEFIQATSVLGDSKTLLEFLIDCICVAAETPRWAIFAEAKSTTQDASVEPFKKKIERKRVNFTEPYVMLCKMALVATGRSPETVRLNWPPVSLDDLASHGQSAQQVIMGLDVATANGWIAESTAVKVLSVLFPQMNDPATEMRLAKQNVNYGATAQASAPAPASATQALHPPLPSASQNGNGGGSKEAATAAVKRLTTTTPSRS
jgi:hypothetical protein